MYQGGKTSSTATGPQWWMGPHAMWGALTSVWMEFVGYDLKPTYVVFHFKDFTLKLICHTVDMLSFSSYWTIENLWVWITTQSLSTPLLLLLFPPIQETHAHTSTGPGFTGSALPPATEACSTAAWSVGSRTRQTPMWSMSHTASHSACRGHRVSRRAACIHVLQQSSAPPASVWFVSHNVDF